VKKFRTITLGCRVNQYETAFVREALLQSGWEETPRGGEAEAGLVLINTCSVTAESDAKCRKAISTAAELSPEAEIVVMGCYATAAPERVARFPHVSEVITDKRRLPEFIQGRGWHLPQGISSFGERHRAYIKVQDGCRVGCSYCLIPKVRPYLSSRTEEEILCEVTESARRGYREIVLSGIHLGHYGLDLVAADRHAAPQQLGEYLEERRAASTERRHTLASLLRVLVERVAEPRYRLGSLEAVEVSDELALMAVEYPRRVCPHFHLSMQSGDDAVLARMKRRWPSGPYIERALSLRRMIPRVALTTDIIVGFPGETDAEFRRTCEVVEAVRFAKIHIFRYSRRPGTEAAEMKNQVPEPVKKERAAVLAEIAQRLRVEYAQSLVGSEVTVLTEERCGALMQGTCEYFLPVRFEAGLPLGVLRKVRVLSAEGEMLLAQDAESPETPFRATDRLDNRPRFD
jgi:threonylcarbamoyladenosine tRNA methylthiotransferase MtaB